MLFFWQSYGFPQWVSMKIIIITVLRKKTKEACFFFSVYFNFVVVQLLSHVWLFASPWTVARQASLSLTISQSLLKLMSIESVMPSNHLILCQPLLLSSIFPSIRVFSNESGICISCPKYWSFSISPSSEYSGLISFRIDWLDLLAVQGTLKTLLQHHRSEASILQHSSFSDYHKNPWAKSSVQVCSLNIYDLHQKQQFSFVFKSSFGLTKVQDWGATCYILIHFHMA